MSSSCELYSVLLDLDLTVARELVTTNNVPPLHGRFCQDIADCLRRIFVACHVLAISLPLYGSVLYCLVQR
jgi:hypothetical protein